MTQPAENQAELAAAEPQPLPCRHCGARRSRVRYTFADHDKVIRECRSCHLMVLDPMPSEDELSAVYNEGYFDNEQLTQADPSRMYGYVDYISERINKQRGYRAICERVRELLLCEFARPRLLDYGCGLGFFLDAAYEYGFDVEGVEFNRYALNYIRKRYRYPAHGPEEPTGQLSWDVITMFDVIEHLRDPFAMLDTAHRLLVPDGLLVLSTMDSTSLTSRLMGKRLEDFRRIREHLFFFDRANLASILGKHGFDVLRSESLGHSFELRLLASRLRATVGIIGVPMQLLLRVFPFMNGWSVYVNPRTKFIVYARKRGGGSVRLE
jgi:2-polyprenyl-3-methyl-5-hydroxy-6-metoxy-1,4-benzoquinol methylase